jgi:hypothetical protein
VKQSTSNFALWFVMSLQSILSVGLGVTIDRHYFADRKLTTALG